MNNNEIEKIFDQLRNRFIIIGLTGAIGSGCTTSANFLTKQLTDKDINSILDCAGQDKNEFNTEYRRIQKVKQYYKDKGWKSFISIKVSDILLLVLIASINGFEISINQIIEGSAKEDDKRLKELLKKEILEDENKVEKAYNDLSKISEEYKRIISEYNKDNKDSISLILKETKRCMEEYIDKNKQVYTDIFQSIGENIRKNGSVFYNGSSSKLYELYNIDDENLPIFLIPELIRRTIKLFRTKDKKDFFVIDALRNIYEIEFFRNRYQSFYLFSIQASESIRQQRILDDFGLSPEGFEQIKKFETKDNNIASQAINSCIGKGDVFINNDTIDAGKTNLKLQLLKYIALIRKPGLFTPTDDERYMQVAFTARYNSGCISRQVGAVVVGNDGYIRGFGWNDVPEDHVSCLYRTPNQLLGCSTNPIFSQYERSEEFFEFVKENISKEEQDYPFCFKDLRNKIELQEKIESIYKKINKEVNKDQIKDILQLSKIKNPTRERALHAEENAFLQITKSGGQTVVDGTLYTTDSPCQLCSKKAMQLKISRIVYIDAYPDISIEHTLQAGKKEKWPKFEMFKGAIGSAYFKLYIPIIGIKDEINEIIRFKKSDS